MPSKTNSSKKLKDPKGGLTSAGRKHFAETEGAHLKPGVQKKESEMSLDEMKRKGSFLRRHYGRKNPFKLVDKKGEPTRYALQAQAWGEKLPKTPEDVERLAAKGHKLLEKAHKQEEKKAKGAAQGKAKTPSAGESKKPAATKKTTSPAKNKSAGESAKSSSGTTKKAAAAKKR